ncbi:MAG: hypothetical protein Q7S92_07190 [Candidatus Diapherotrites archaeon]|nr:hypothetical protein [Candidatus Diapherotrites archaeon]
MNFKNLIEKIKTFFKSERAQNEWSTVYLLIVLIIAALVLIAVVKPMFQQSQDVVARTTQSVQQGP